MGCQLPRPPRIKFSPFEWITSMRKKKTNGNKLIRSSADLIGWCCLPTKSASLSSRRAATCAPSKSGPANVWEKKKKERLSYKSQLTRMLWAYRGRGPLFDVNVSVQLQRNLIRLNVSFEVEWTLFLDSPLAWAPRLKPIMWTFSNCRLFVLFRPFNKNASCLPTKRVFAAART